jgi:hypothetical protein
MHRLTNLSIAGLGFIQRLPQMFQIGRADSCEERTAYLREQERLDRIAYFNSKALPHLRIA